MDMHPPEIINDIFQRLKQNHSNPHLGPPLLLAAGALLDQYGGARHGTAATAWLKGVKPRCKEPPHAYKPRI